ncbi:MAG TPA: adenylate/guanylate cyclase domain-containing protein, partial [Methylomirabilota bacterium]|nr:adenylate/guanylate cyclase domain-containing protein [Methylomirabilota bacterium]
MSTGLLFTFLFTDIEGSAERFRTFPEAMPAAMERHNALIRAAVERHGGRVFKRVGDEVCAVFDAPPSALLAAIEAQRGLRAEDWSQFSARFAPLDVRMGLHIGRARSDGDDFEGHGVVVSARIMSAANGGQIFCSHTTTRRLGKILPAGVSLRDLG